LDAGGIYIKKVFIAHSSLDKDFVDELAANLKHNGIQVWYDKWDMKVGDSLREKISEGIENSDFMIVVLSANSIKSPWVKDELNAGLAKALESQSTFILPILLDGDVKSIPLFLRDKLFADFTLSYDRGFSQLVGAILDKSIGEVKFIKSKSSDNWKEVLDELTKDTGWGTRWALSQFVSGINNRYGLGDINWTLHINGFYEAECEMTSTVYDYDSLVLHGLVTSAISVWDLESRPKVYRLMGILTKLGFIIAKELSLNGIDKVNLKYLPGK
jgi:hypothetical protein